jgi:filamentous hemagglutinin family protein
MAFSLRLRAALKSSASLRWTTVLLLAVPLLAGPAVANPLGDVVAAGSASISSPTAGQTKVDQTSEDVVVDWSSFNIGTGQMTQFVQPNAQAIAVNRIGGSAPSQIMGNLDANGRIVLINDNGMVFGKGSQVNVGSLAATSAGGADSDVLAGKFAQAGNRNASIVSQGTINASQGGFVALVAPHVSNSGTVSAKLGTVALGGATQFTVDFAGDGLVSFAAQGKGSASVTNSGTLAGANVSLTARAAEGVATGVVNMSGMIVAQGARERGGTIVLDAGNGGDVAVSNANLDASGANGGGSIHIGGWNQNAVTVDRASVIDASATNSGNGGTISVISANTSFEGQALAQGGRQSGNGGTIETSGHDLAFDGARVNASSTHGADGQWLLDPYDLTVDSTAASTIDSALNSGTGVTLQTTATGASGPGNPNSSGNGDIFIDSPISWSTTATLTLDAYHSIFIDAPVTVTGAGNLTMLTNDGGTGGDLSFDGGNVIFKKLTGALMINGANYTLVNSIAALSSDIAANPSGDYALAYTYNAKGDGTYAASPVSVPFAGIFDGLGNTISDLTIDDTTDTDVGLFADLESGGAVRDIALIRVSVTGTATDADVGGLIGYMATGSSVENASIGGRIVSDAGQCSGCDPAGVGGLVGSSYGSIAQSFSTARVLGNGEYAYVGGLVGTDLGTIANSYTTGAVSGSDDPAAGGLVGFGYGETISNSYATGMVSGGGGDAFAGGLAGQSTDGTIEFSYATGKASGAFAGGLAALNAGTIDNSYATGNVSGGEAGGLVGASQGNDSYIGDSYATGAVRGGKGSWVGGLVGGDIQTSISGSYATGDVSGGVGSNAGGSGSYAGGLVGYFLVATIENSYATGTVIAGSNVSIGGLVGYSEGSIGDSYATGAVTDRGASAYVGGLVGWNEEGIISNSYASGAVTGGLNADIGGLAGIGGTIDTSYATGAVSGGANAAVGGLAGYDGTIDDSYATGGVSGGHDAFVGGLVGKCACGAVSYSYATGAVGGRAGATLGGLVGFDSGESSYTDDYWDMTTSGITNPSQGAGNIVNDPGITGLTTVQLQSGLPTGFDPTIWGESASINGGLPYLLALPPS